jgi:hypothetical protein
MGNFDYKKYLTEGKLLKEEEGTYRVYMNSDMDEPERINYEEYFGDGTKAEMIKQAKKMAYSNDPTNQYGDPILVKVVHEDDIDDVAFTNESVNEGKDLYHVLVRDTGEIISDDDGPFDKSFAKRFAAKKKGWIIKKVDESVNEDSTPSIEDVRLYIQKELGRAGEQDAGLDAYIDSIQRDFAAGRDAYDDYEMDDYLEDLENYIADKMDY